MATMTMTEGLDAAAVKSDSLVCVGLDPDPARMPVNDIFEFNRAIIDTTKDIVAAYKPQLAFYEAEGSAGLRALEKTVQHIRDVAPHVFILGDAKRCDMGNTSVAYARAMFDTWDFDGVTLVPYIGSEGVEPFLSYPGRGVFILCRSSNPSARDLQDLEVQRGDHTQKVYEVVAQYAENWGHGGNVGLVVGATYPGELRSLRRSHPELPMLIPGVGAQGGDAATTARLGANSDSRGMVISSSRGIIYASDDPKQFAAHARRACMALREEINEALRGPALTETTRA